MLARPYWPPEPGGGAVASRSSWTDRTARLSGRILCCSPPIVAPHSLQALSSVAPPQSPITYGWPVSGTQSGARALTVTRDAARGRWQ